MLLVLFLEYNVTVWITARRALSQFWSFKIPRTTFLNYIKFVDPRFLGTNIVKGLVGCFSRTDKRKDGDEFNMMTSLKETCSAQRSMCPPQFGNFLTTQPSSSSFTAFVTTKVLLAGRPFFSSHYSLSLFFYSENNLCSGKPNFKRKEKRQTFLVNVSSLLFLPD